MSDTKLRFTGEQLKEFAAYHDKFLRGIGCRRDNFHRKRMYLLEKKFHQYYLRFDTGIENQDIDGACDRLCPTSHFCPITLELAQQGVTQANATPNIRGQHVRLPRFNKPREQLGIFSLRDNRLFSDPLDPAITHDCRPDGQLALIVV